jgi:hypothetical protein
LKDFRQRIRWLEADDDALDGVAALNDDDEDEDEDEDDDENDDDKGDASTGRSLPQPPPIAPRPLSSLSVGTLCFLPSCEKSASDIFSNSNCSRASVATQLCPSSIISHVGYSSLAREIPDCLMIFVGC